MSVEVTNNILALGGGVRRLRQESSIEDSPGIAGDASPGEYLDVGRCRWLSCLLRGGLLLEFLDRPVQSQSRCGGSVIVHLPELVGAVC